VRVPRGAIPLRDALLDEAVADVDTTLLDWYLALSLVERLRAASRSAATLERLARAAAADR
jgi:hypothetical protein